MNKFPFHATKYKFNYLHLYKNIKLQEKYREDDSDYEDHYLDIKSLKDESSEDEEKLEENFLDNEFEAIYNDFPFNEDEVINDENNSINSYSASSYHAVYFDYEQYEIREQIFREEQKIFLSCYNFAYEEI
jgi:predicted transposase YbfD/YdcC